MYIWVILATLILALYSFNLSYRSDIRKIEIEPLARSIISKILIKQQAAALYIKAHTPPYAQIQSPDGTSSPSNSVTFSAGKLSKEDLSASGGGSYFPYGFVDDESVITEIYCLSEDGASALDCNNEDSITYLVSFYVLPQKWLSIRTGLPSNDFLNAMKDMVGDNPGFGYPICKKYAEGDSDEKKCEQLVIQSHTGAYQIGYDENEEQTVTDLISFEIPPYIAQSGEFANTCNNSNNSNMCITMIYKNNIKSYEL